MGNVRTESLVGGHVFYLAEQETRGLFELHVVAISGTGLRRKLGPLMPLREVLTYQVSPDGTRAVHLEVPLGNYGLTTIPPDGSKLYSQPIDGSESPVALDGGPFGSNRKVAFYQISPDGSRVVFSSDQDGGLIFELFSVPIDGSSPATQLNPMLVSGGSIARFDPDFRISPDGTRVVYRGDQQVDERFELFCVPIDGSAGPIKLNGPLVSGGDVSADFQITPDGAHVVYVADKDVAGRLELYSVPIAGGTSVKLNGALTAFGNVSNGGTSGRTFWITPDSTRVVYLADQDTDGKFELYGGPLDASSSPVKLNAALLSSGDVRANVVIAPSGNRVVFQAGGQNPELFSAPVDGSAAAVRLNGPLTSNGATDVFLVSPDGSRVIYRADQAVNNVFQLHSAPIDGSSPDVQLTSAGAKQTFHTSADGRLVVYIDEDLFLDPSDGEDLYLVPSDGSASPQRVSQVFPGGNALSFEFDADAQFVVYIAPEDSLHSELYQRYLSLPFKRRGGAKPH